MNDIPVGVLRTARRIALAAFLLFALTGGGRIAGSDEVSMFELARSLLHGGVEVPEGATLQGADGRFYTKNAAGQAVLALPLVATSEVAARLSGLSPQKQRLAARFGASFFNAGITAILLAAFYVIARLLGVSAMGSFAAVALLGFTTPVWVYAKSFMAEPLQALGLLLTLGGAARTAAGETRRSPWIAGLGVLIAVSAKLSMLPLAVACATPLLSPAAGSGGSWLTRWRGVALGLVAALAGQVIYNVARFHTPLETGYGAQATPAAYTTPLLVGLYGLLFSSGKGIAWFAPAIWLAPFGLLAMRHSEGEVAAAPEHPVKRVAKRLFARVKQHFSSAEEVPVAPDAERRRMRAHAARVAANGVLAACVVALAMYSCFEHWAGDGSWGPRYLVPLLPLCFLAVAFALERMTLARQRLAAALGVIGCVIQLGGVFIYFGAQMREAGDYPYTRALNDPHFMSESHFNPRYSPIAGHWKMLLRNLDEHRRGGAPRLAGGGDVDPRLGISADDQRELLHAFDVWWMYAIYAGVPAKPIDLAVVLLVIAAAFAVMRARNAALLESRDP